MTDKEILKGFQEQFQTGGLLTESNVLVIMGYTRGDARKCLIEKLPSDEDIELEIIDNHYPTYGNQLDNSHVREGIRIGSRFVRELIKKL
jgi:Icc-related predicted phosphoesterase